VFGCALDELVRRESRRLNWGSRPPKRNDHHDRRADFHDNYDDNDHHDSRLNPDLPNRHRC
jgi:hypothetical protein